MGKSSRRLRGAGVGAALAVAAGALTLGGTAQPASAADDQVPDCVKTETVNEVFGYFGVFMTNNCDTEQRVLPTFLRQSADTPVKCHTLQPGQEATQWVHPSYLLGQRFLGLVRC
ncbi:hypothetical protein [Streptomyces sp. WG5]|uniref:hypothetical protein n=1 Tax=Streptomyces sp. WG5 TaxID=3417648 RepID=UPI003CF588D0